MFLTYGRHLNSQGGRWGQLIRHCEQRTCNIFRVIITSNYLLFDMTRQRLTGDLERLTVLTHGTVVDGLGEVWRVIVDVNDVDDDVDDAAEWRFSAVRALQCQLVTCCHLAVGRSVCCHYHVRVHELFQQREMSLLHAHVRAHCNCRLYPV